MIVPEGVDLDRVSREDLVAAYVRDGYTVEEAEAFAGLLLDGPAPDDPPVR